MIATHSTQSIATIAHSREEFDRAQLTQWQWKTEPMLNMAIAIVQLALDRGNLPLAQCEFAADDLPQDMEHGGTGIAGSIFARLEQNGIIKRVGIWRADEDGAKSTFYGKERASRREGRKAAKLKVYELADFAKAKAFLKAKHRFKELKQLDLLQT